MRHSEKMLAFMLLLSSGTASPTLAAAKNPTLPEQRQLFLKAEHALKSNQPKLAHRLSQQLKDYPLYPYLQATRITRYFSSYKQSQVNHFLQQHANTPIADSVQNDWMHFLAKKKRWKEYLKYHTPSDDPILACHQITAAWATNKRLSPADKKAIEQLWLVNHSQPQACDPLFKKWMSHYPPSQELIWQRLKLATDAENRLLVSYLKRFLPIKHQQFVTHWLNIQRHPKQYQRLLTPPLETTINPLAEQTFQMAMSRLITKDDQQFIKAWPGIKQTYQPKAALVANIEQELALLLALRHRTNAPAWFTKLAQQKVNKDLAEWRVRHAIRQQDWQTVNQWLNALPSALKKRRIWQYWRARATPHQAKQRSMFQLLAKQNDYYGLLAQEQLGRRLSFPSHQQQVTQAELEEITRIPGIQRARELFYLHKLGAARTEWEVATGLLNQQQQQVAAYLAKQWAWYDRTIRTAYRANLSHHVALTHPLANQHQMLNDAGRYALDPALPFAIARQESAFTTDAKSRVGALGVMQLLPKTAKQVARTMKIRYHGPKELLKANKNIHLGTAYLSKLNQQFFGHPVLMAAAYNAGPNRVQQWLPQHALPADIWIDTIPYAETRGYLKNILVNTGIYEHQLGLSPSLIAKMQPVVSS